MLRDRSCRPGPRPKGSGLYRQPGLRVWQPAARWIHASGRGDGQRSLVLRERPLPHKPHQPPQRRVHRVQHVLPPTGDVQRSGCGPPPPVHDVIPLSANGCMPLLHRGGTCPPRGRTPSRNVELHPCSSQARGAPLHPAKRALRRFPPSDEAQPRPCSPQRGSSAASRRASPGRSGAGSRRKPRSTGAVPRPLNQGRDSSQRERPPLSSRHTRRITRLLHC
mmetsp:Transcript_28977/g.94404  ORF Transcript_28977/g.94404 Transcript_28977/m.94404 type:complete len:221 (-) Transcript_28977:2169-2831(-)